MRQYIASQNSPEIANGYVDRIIRHCLKLGEMPHRGTMHEELRPGLRTIPFDRRMTIAFAVVGYTVEVLAIAYAGRDLANLLR